MICYRHKIHYPFGVTITKRRVCLGYRCIALTVLYRLLIKLAARCRSTFASNF